MPGARGGCRAAGLGCGAGEGRGPWPLCIALLEEGAGKAEPQGERGTWEGRTGPTTVASLRMGAGLRDAVAAAGVAACAWAAVVEAAPTPTLCLGLVAAVMLWVWKPTPPRLADGSVVAGPGRSLPFIGATIELLREFDTVPEWLTREQSKAGWGKTWGGSTLRMGGFSEGYCVLATPAAVQHVLKDNFENYHKGEPFRRVLGDFLGNGIFATDGATWRHHRK